ncbi:hypothetical protein SESBI_02337 [Sesbania bispinosa]|nr:hypothetical protein SESBI_02337 [Sesbania bispinosa]
MTIGAAQVMLRCVFDGSISMQSVEKERRPYHKNCSCELHKLKHGCSCAFPQQRMVAFPKRQSWSDCSLSTKASKTPTFTEGTIHGEQDKNKAGSYNHI